MVLLETLVDDALLPQVQTQLCVMYAAVVGPSIESASSTGASSSSTFGFQPAPETQLGRNPEDQMAWAMHSSSMTPTVARSK